MGREGCYYYLGDEFFVDAGNAKFYSTRWTINKYIFMGREGCYYYLGDEFFVDAGNAKFYSTRWTINKNVWSIMGNLCAQTKLCFSLLKK